MNTYEGGTVAICCTVLVLIVIEVSIL